MWIKRRDTAKRYALSVRSIERLETEAEKARARIERGEPIDLNSNPQLRFPRSRIMNGRRYDDTDKLDLWDAQCAAAGRTRTPPAAGRRSVGTAAG